ncbi:MAG: GGDEF domain-containing protein, partial [Succinivibrio sp.]
MIFDYVLKCELHFLIIMMLVVVIRSIIREHDHTSRSYLLCCYTLIFATVLRLAISFLDGSRYMELQYALQSLDCIVWCFLPFTWLVTVMSKLGFYDITQSLSIKLALILPLALTVCLSIISPFYPLIFKFNLFNEPVACQYSFIYYMMLAFYGVTSCLLTFYRMYAFSKAGERRESLFLFIASIVLLVMHHHYTFTGNIFYHVALMIILVFYYMNIHEDKFFTDPLTGLNNRNRFRKYLSQILSSQSAKTNMYLTYIDIDDFKKINDNYGHLTGDLALRTVSESMREIAAQSHSFIARIGDDELAI